MDRDRERGLAEAAPIFQRGEPATSGQVREVQASVAKTHFSQLLDEVERGATIVILRHGHPVARVIPDPERRKQTVKKALANIKKLGEEIREKHGAMTLDEILSLRHEGHKY